MSHDPSTLLQGSLLLLEDERPLGSTLKIALEKMGFQVFWVQTVRDAIEMIRIHQNFKFWILDRNLPDGEGLDLLKHRKYEESVLVLSAKSGLDDRVMGLEKGADDYLPKPFSIKELEARMKALLRTRYFRPDSEREAPLKKFWSLDEKTLTIKSAQGSHPLTPLEFKFLKYVMDRDGEVVSKEQLLKEVWGFRFLPKTRTVDYLITQIRKRIEPKPEEPVFLLTIRGVGVRFVNSDS